MTTSGTTAFNPDVSVLIEEAYERAGVEIRSGYEFRTAVRTLNFLLASWANRGLNLWTIDEEVQALTPGLATYTAPADTVDLIQAVVRTDDLTDITMERITVSGYAQIPNKTSQGLPIQYYVQRLVTAPIITLWPVPDNNYSFVYWRMRRLQDAGSAVNTEDVPFRFVPALVAGLAYMVAVKNPRSADRVPYLKSQYDEEWDLAAGEDRDRSSFFFYPSPAYP